MSGKMMVCLVGGQTIPNLVPLLHFHQQGKADYALLVCSTETSRQSKQTANLLPPTLTSHELVLTDEYNVELSITEIENKISELGWQADDLLFNITGGTKTMMIAAYQLALRLGCELNYYQTGKGGGSIHCYKVNGGELGVPVFDAPASVLSIDTYFRAYGVDVSRRKSRKQLQQDLDNLTDPGEIKGHTFELAVYDVIEPLVDEIYASVYPIPLLTSPDPQKKRPAAIELDLIIRKGNIVAIAEVKCGSKSRERKGIDQLVIAGGQPYGTFTGKLFITDEPTGEQNQDFIDAYKIEHCVLGSYAQIGVVSSEDGDKLKAAIDKVLGVKLYQLVKAIV